MPANTCETCAHWTVNRMDEWGECAAIVDDLTATHDAIAVITNYEHERDDGPILSTRRNFYCAAWMPNKGD